MQRLPLLLALSLLLPAAATAGPGKGKKVNFTFTPPAAGLVWTESQTMEMVADIDIEIGGNKVGSMQSRSSEASIVSLELVAWSADRREAVLRYGVVGSTEVQTLPDGSKDNSDTPGPTSGKAYRGTQAGTADATFVGLDGSAVTPAELDVLNGAWTDLPAIEEMGIEKLLTSKTWRVGEELESDPAELGRLLDMDDDEAMSVKSGSMSLTELRKVDGVRCAAFAVNIQVGLAEDEFGMTMTMAGEMVVTVNGLRPVSLALAGPLTIAGEVEEEGMSMKMTGGGTFGANMTYAWGK